MRVRDLFLNHFNSEEVTNKNFLEKNVNKIFYFNGREALMDIFYFKIFKSRKVDSKMIELIEIFKDKKMPIMPLKANTLIEKYNISEGIELGKKLKTIEQVWTSNNFQISEKEIEKIVSN